MMAFGYTVQLVTRIEKDLNLKNKFRTKFESIPKDYLKQYNHESLKELYKNSAEDYSDFLAAVRQLGFSYKIQSDYQPSKQRRPIKIHKQAMDYINLLFDFMDTFTRAVIDYKYQNKNPKAYFSYVLYLSQ